MPSPLPARRDPGSTYRIALVCLGNICRSPIAEVVLRQHVERAGLDRDVELSSAGTGGWHVGEPMDRRAAAVLAAHGYDGSDHRGRQFEPAWFEAHDLVLAMDAGNHAELSRHLPPGDEERLRLFRDFDPLAGEADREVPDPYYGGDEGFTAVLALVERTAAAIVTALESELDGG